MAAEVKKEIELEIGHVLFIDIVSYSKMLITEQSELLETLKQIVRGTEQFRLAKAEGKLLGLPTGDGGALVFRTSPEAPVLCAIEISRELKDHPELRVRMGIHSGPVNEISDLNEQANIAGAGINIAQRVMDCGDAGHILLSQHVADDLEQYPRWRAHLHDLGECEVKHGVRIDIANLYSDEVGNSELPKKFQAVKKHRARMRWAEAAIAVVVLAAIVAAFVFLLRRPTRSATAIVGKKHCRSPLRKLKPRSRQRLFRRRRPGRDPDAVIQNRRFEGDLAYIHAALQERAGKPARDRPAAWGRPHPGRKRAEEWRRRARECAADQSSQ